MTVSLYTYRAEVVDWIDGDTVKVRVDLGFKLFLVESVRVYGINAPELHSRNEEERLRAKAARTYAGVLAPAGRSFLVRSHKDQDKYGRYLAEIFLDDGRNLGDELIRSGNAKPWDGTGERP